MADSLLDQVAGTSQSAAAPASTPAAQSGSLLDQVAQENPQTTPASTTGTNQSTTPSYLSQVEDHIKNTAHAIWHGATGQEESDAERGAKAGQFKQFGFTNENAGYNIGALGRGVAGFLGGFAKDALSKMPIIMPDDKKISWSDPKANTLIGKYLAAPSEAERQKALAEAEAYTGTKGTEAIGHLLNTYIHTAGEYIPVAGPFVASLVDKAESGDIGGAATQVAALAAAHPIAEAIKEKAGYAPRTDNWWEKQKADAKAATVAKPVSVAGVPRNPEIGPQERTVSGPQTTLRPTTQTTAGVTAPITALQQENVSPLATVGAKLASPGSDAEFQKTQTQPAAQRQLISTIGQAAEDKIAKHEAIMDGKPTPNPIAGSQTPSKFQTFDDAAKATELSATKTYQKADAVSDKDIAAWQTATRDALNEHKAAIDRYNQMVDQYNENRNTADDKEMPRATYDPNAVSVPEKPQSYSELKAELDRAKAEGASSDAAVREEAYKTGIPKAEKAIDQWFKQHSNDISPAEYASAKSLYADSQRFQEVANGLRSATNKGTLTGNTLRGLESTIDNKMIRRGQAPGAFQRLLGEDAYDNWTNVAKLFDPVKGALQGQKSWGTYATEYIVASVLGIKGIAAKAATELLMNRIMFHPEWGQWFSKFTNTLKNLATREHGELGAPGTVGEAFGQDDKQHFYDLMNAAQGKAAGEVKAQARPSLLDQVESKSEPSVGDVVSGEDVAKHVLGTSTRFGDSRPFLNSTQEAKELMGVDAGGSYRLENIPLTRLEAGDDYSPAIAKQYAQMDTPIPSIVMDSSGGIRDGNHRIAAARYRGEKMISAYVPVDNSAAFQLRDVVPPNPLKDATIKTEDGITSINHPDGALQMTVKDGVAQVKGIYGSKPGMGQRLYDTAIQHAESVGAKEFRSDEVRTSDAEDAWRRLSTRYDVTRNADGTYSIPLNPKEALPEAKLATAVTDEYKRGLGANEIATTRPSAVGTDNTNNPARTSGIKTLAEATPKMRETIAQSIANYKDTGLKLTPAELEDPASYQASIIKKAVAHYKDNLVALYNAIPESIRGISKQWYESAHGLSKKFSEQYDVSHPQAAAVIAALSPNNPWDNNVGMAQRLMERWKNDQGRVWDEKMDEKLSAIRNAKSTKPEFRAYLDSIRGKSYNDLQGETEAETAAMKGLWLRMVDQTYGSPEIPVYAPDGTIRGSQKIAWGPYDAVAKAVKILDDGDIETINHLMGNGHKIRNFYNNIINPRSDRGHVTIDTHAVGAAHWKPFSQKDTEVAHNFGGSTPGVPGAGKHAGTGLQGTYPIYDEAYKQAAKEVGVSPRELQSISWEGIRSLFSGAKKTPELRKAVGEIWAKVGEGKMKPEAARQAIIEQAGGFKRPVWTTDNQWNGAQTPNPSVTERANQIVSLGEGANSIQADVNPAGLNPELKGQPTPTLTRNPSGHVPMAQIHNLAAWYNANVEPKDMLISTAHEIAHEFTQHHHGIPMEKTSINLGHSALPNAISGGYLETGPGWNNRLKAARELGGDAMSSFLDDYSSHVMAGRAIEEMLGEPASVVKEHASGDVRALKPILRQAGVHPHLMDKYIEAATDRAKEILRDKWATVRHMTTQAVQHYGGNIDAATLQKYREGGMYKK
jgi:hypothetical protein